MYLLALVFGINFNSLRKVLGQTHGQQSYPVMIPLILFLVRNLKNGFRNNLNKRLFKCGMPRPWHRFGTPTQLLDTN